MRVTDLTARWQRRLPREQYGHAEVELTTHIVLDDDDDPEECAGAALKLVRNAVSAKLGITVPDDDEKPANKTDKKKPGRPKGSGKSTDKEEKEPAKEPAKETEVPDDDTEVPDDNIRANPEDRKNPEDDDVPGDEVPGDEVPGDDEVPDDSDTGMTAVELAKFLTEQVKNKVLTVEQVKEILSSHGAARTNELKPDQIKTVYDLVSNMKGD